MPSMAPAPAPLTTALVEIERHVALSGWDQPPRLYALAQTAELVTREPELAATLGVGTAADPADLTPVEQDSLPHDRPLDEVLSGIAWPPAVVGCALALERIVLPPEAEEELPENEGHAAEWAARHPDRSDVRIVVGVLRDGASSVVLRVRGHDGPEDRVRDAEVSTDLVAALAATLGD
jgi:hypothetical protein